MNQLEKKVKESEAQSRIMKQNFDGKAENVKLVLKKIAEKIFKISLTAIYLIILIHFVLKPLIEFFVMLEHYIYANIMKYLFN